ncbi:hypothetical protein GGQ63_004234 [Prosthecomicrobium pneumaticum]|uniref:Uncharacterized protein n=1 Tax=Prosthecomicrobium pneumaticum TaxID=81895 RepID=A0A7W9L418_9HYPH|nr:hypothetical protein [Prosthecomicrobium pneumaticum]
MTTRTGLAAVWPPTAGVAAEAGHQPVSPLRAIRTKCVDCCGGRFSEVRLCEAVKCALWPFRAGRHPYHALSQKQAGNSADQEIGEAIQ